MYFLFARQNGWGYILLLLLSFHLIIKFKIYSSCMGFLFLLEPLHPQWMSFCRHHKAPTIYRPNAIQFRCLQVNPSFVDGDALVKQTPYRVKAIRFTTLHIQFSVMLKLISHVNQSGLAPSFCHVAVNAIFSSCHTMIARSLHEPIVINMYDIKSQAQCRPHSTYSRSLTTF